jgi:outer membrane immunogenic protein
LSGNVAALNWRIDMKCLLLAGFLVAAMATSAMAADGPYIGVNGGVTIFKDSDINISGVGSGTLEYKTGGAVNINAGYDFGAGRIEAEWGYKSVDIDSVSAGSNSASVSDSSVNIKSYMVNGYYDMHIANSGLVPFLGAGIGLLDGEFKESGSSENVSEFGYQFMAGAGFKASEHVTLELSYRYQGSSDFSKEGTSISYGSSNILAGLRYKF